jgi:hypothetical protein
MRPKLVQAIGKPIVVDFTAAIPRAMGPAQISRRRWKAVVPSRICQTRRPVGASFGRTFFDCVGTSQDLGVSGNTCCVL